MIKNHLHIQKRSPLAFHQNQRIRTAKPAAGFRCLRSWLRSSLIGFICLLVSCYQGSSLSEPNCDAPCTITHSMAFFLQCDVSLQDCNALWPRATSQQVAFTNTSCVRDPRIPGNVGRCGWAGAQCQVNTTVSDCSWPYAEVCMSGICAGGVGQPCIPIGDRYTCNSPVNCNITVGLGPRAICGGEGASVHTEDASKGLDFAMDYCVSGKATQNSSQYWICTAGDDPISPAASTISPLNAANPTALPSTRLAASKPNIIGPIAGGVIGCLILCFLLAFCWYRRRMRSQRLYRVDAWKSGEEATQEPSPLLHRRGLSEQSHVTTGTTHSTSTSQSHVSPFSVEQSPEMRAATIAGARKFAHLGPPINAAAAASPSTETTESSDVHSQETHITPPPLARKDSAPLVPAFVAHSGFTSSTATLSQDSHEPSGVIATNLPSILPTVSFVTSPFRSQQRMKTRNGSASSLPRSRLTSASTPRRPESPLISQDNVEQRLLELRNEADRGLAEIRAQRTGSAGDGEMPPPYHFP